MDAEGSVEFIFDILVGSDVVDVAVSVENDHRLEVKLGNQREDPFRLSARVDDGTFQGFRAGDEIAICVQGTHHDKLVVHRLSLVAYNKSNSGPSQENVIFCL
jgi:hypothetical protein